MGIGVSESSNVRVIGNYVKGNSDDGIRVVGACTNVGVVGNTCESNTVNGIYFVETAGGGQYCTVEDNISRLNGGYGMRIRQLDDGIISRAICALPTASPPTSLPTTSSSRSAPPAIW